MGLNRVIQDSDEDEPFEGDGVPTPADPLQLSEHTSQQQHHDIPAKEMTHYAMHGHGSGPDVSEFPQLNVNFDEFLQSQERSHAMASASQQRLEDKWIPSASEGGSGSVGTLWDSTRRRNPFIDSRDSSGAMMAEIGVAQRRLLDDDPSSANVQLPDAATLYSMDSIQSAPFPTIQSSYGYQMGQSNSLSYAGASNGAYADVNQSSLPTRQGIYDFTPPETTRSMASSPKAVPQQPMEPPMDQRDMHSNLHQEASLPNLHQMGPYSSHDTEPFSSVVSAGLNGARTDTAATSLIPLQISQTSTHDELAMPAALPAVLPSVDVPAAKKKRGRPKKQPLPENDEDDELANSRDHEFKHPSANGAIDPSDSEETTENNTPASSGVSDETNEEILESTPKQSKSNLKEPKKKKAKKAQATPPPVPDDDDVIWVDTKPLDAQPSIENATPQTETPQPTEPDVNSAPDSSKVPTPAVEENPQTVETTEKPAPKKRGRKRKQITEQVETPSKTTETPEPSKPKHPETPGPELAVLVDNSPKSMTEANANDENDTSALQNQNQNQNQNQDQEQNPNSALDAHPATMLDTPNPQTPSKPDAASVNTPQNTGKGPNKHSPISARSAVPYRVGLSKRARIAPLLKIVRK